MHLTFYGAAGCVTGSKTLVENGKQRFLVDCGLFQGIKALRVRNWQRPPLDLETLQGIFLTHAHIDHSGYLPAVVKHGYTGPIFVSAATADLLDIMLKDSAHLQAEDAEFANRRGYSKHKPAKPLYTMEDVEKTLKQLEIVDTEKNLECLPGLETEYTQAGHILGACSIRFANTTSSVLFSGDLGQYDDPLMHGAQSPKGAHALVLESTYGDRLHHDTPAKDELKMFLNDTLSKGGTVVIPSFAVGRAQTICSLLYDLVQAGDIPDVPVYLDSPMASKVFVLYHRHPELHRLQRDDVEAIAHWLNFCHDMKDSLRLHESKKAKIIVSASGMASGGRVLHHINHFGRKPEHLILFTGYQASGTRGQQMLSKNPTIKIHGDVFRVRAKVEKLTSLSAHADRNDLCKWLEALKPEPQVIMLNHGEPEVTEAFRHHLEEQYNIPTYVPLLNDSFNLQELRAKGRL